MDVAAQIAYWRDSALEDWVVVRYPESLLPRLPDAGELKNLIDQTEEVLAWLIQRL